jgi:glycosyltransferase involved in cell wall biosynthesis
MGMVDQEWDLQKLRHDLGVEDYVEFPTDLTSQAQGIPAQGVVERMQAADCAVHVAHGEGFGLPLVEAMACGLPVLCTKDGRAMEELVGEAGTFVVGNRTITDSSGNWYVDASPEEWASGLVSLYTILKEPDQSKQLSLRARRRGSLYQWEKTAQGLIRSLRSGEEETDSGAWRMG